VGDARAIQGCWLSLRMGEDESYASFIARVNAAARLCALCPSVGAPTNAMYLEVLRDGLCDRLRQFCRNILQRDADIPFSELQEDLVQEERSYFSRRQGEYAKLRTVPFVSPLISAVPSLMSQAKEIANVAEESSNGDERKCHKCGKVGHLVRMCPNARGGNGEKDQVKQEVCRNFERDGTCSYGKGCKFKHTRASGESVQSLKASNPVSPGSAAAGGRAAAIGGAAPAATKGARLSAEEAARQIQEIMARVQCNVTTEVARPGTDLPVDWFADEVCDAAIAFEPANGKFERADVSHGWEGFVDWFAVEACVAIEVEASEGDQVECLENIPGASSSTLDSNVCVLFQGDQEALDEADQDRDYSRGSPPCLIDACDRAHVSVSQVSVWGQRDLGGGWDHHTRLTERDNSGGTPLGFVCTPPRANVPASPVLLVPFPNLLGSAGEELTNSVWGPARARADARAPELVHAGGNGEVGPTPLWGAANAPSPCDGAWGSVVGPAQGGVVGVTPALRGEVGGAGGVIRVGAGGAADTLGVGAGTEADPDPLPGAARRVGNDEGLRSEQGSGRAE
jgi:hypothetical protein